MREITLADSETTYTWIVPMTLILALGNSEQMLQVSDRRLSWEGRIVEDESVKAGLLRCFDARLAFGFTGLAKYGNFRTRDWLLEALMASGHHEGTAKKLLERLRIRASETFRSHPTLRTTQRSDKRLSIMFSGYLDQHTPPLAGFAILTNYQDFNSGQDEIEAWDEFRLTYWAERRPADGEPTLVQRIGNWRAMTQTDEAELRTLLKTRKPANAVVGKAVELIRQMADRPIAAGTIGKQLSVIHVPRDPLRRIRSGYHSLENSYATYLPDNVTATPHRVWAIKDAVLRKISSPRGIPIVMRKVGRNHPCPCGSGKKYKRCCRNGGGCLDIPGE